MKKNIQFLSENCIKYKFLSSYHFLFLKFDRTFDENNTYRRQYMNYSKSKQLKKHQEMINYIDQSEFDQEAISETNKKKEVKNKLQVK